MCLPKDASKEIMAKMCLKEKIYIFLQSIVYYDYSCKLSIVNFRYYNYYLIIIIRWQLFQSSSNHSESLGQKLKDLYPLYHTKALCDAIFPRWWPNIRGPEMQLLINDTSQLRAIRRYQNIN